MRPERIETEGEERDVKDGLPVGRYRKNVKAVSREGHSMWNLDCGFCVVFPTLHEPAFCWIYSCYQAPPEGTVRFFYRNESESQQMRCATEWCLCETGKNGLRNGFFTMRCADTSLLHFLIRYMSPGIVKALTRGLDGIEDCVISKALLRAGCPN